MNDKIADVLGLRPLEEAKKDQLPDVIDDDEDFNLPVATAEDAEHDPTVQDIELARTNIKNIIEQGDDSLKEMINLAKQSESPRAYEVAANLMKTLLDANKDFVDMSMKKKYAKEEILHPKEAASTNVTNNNLILSTTDLLKMIKGDS